MAEIKPGEISQLLKNQLQGLKTQVDYNEIGYVIQAGDGIVRAFGLNNVQANEMVEFENGVKGIALNLEEDNVGIVLLGASEGIKEGDKVRRLNTIASIRVGESLLGRVINTIG